MRAAAENNIIIVESSEIVRGGLTAILNNCLPEIEVVHCNDINELHLFKNKARASVIFVNSALIDTDSETFDFPFQQAPLIGLITNNFFRAHTNLFEDFIYLADSAEKISDIAKKYFYKQPVKKRRQDIKLTSRERDVLELLIKGYANKQISCELHISIHTVITHRQNITTKLGIKSIAGLTIYGVIHNIIDIDDYLEK